MEYGYLTPRADGLGLRLVAPTHCRNGDRLGPNRVLVGWASCRCGRGRTGAHTTWQCRTCGDTQYADGHDDDTQLAQPPEPLLDVHRIRD